MNSEFPTLHVPLLLNCLGKPLRMRSEARARHALQHHLRIAVCRACTVQGLAKLPNLRESREAQTATFHLVEANLTGAGASKIFAMQTWQAIRFL